MGLIAAFLAFGILVVAWLVAPSRGDETPSLALEPQPQYAILCESHAT